MRLSRLRARRFTLQIAGTGVFGGGDKPRSLWVGVERSAELVALRDKIEQAMIRVGLPPEPRKFAPHVTLARLRKPALDKLGNSSPPMRNSAPTRSPVDGVQPDRQLSDQGRLGL